jgi:hypothetical protein
VLWVIIWNLLVDVVVYEIILPPYMDD